MAKEIFIQVGVTALRSPTGEVLPSVPLYIKADQLKQSGLTRAEEKLLKDVSGVFAEHRNEQNQEKRKVKNEKSNIK